MGDAQVGLEKGTVAFGSDLHGWGLRVVERHFLERKEHDIDDRTAT